MEEPRAQRFASYSEYRSAMLDALGRATRTVVIFDPDLRETGLDNPASIAALETLCRASQRVDALRILVHSVDFIERVPRLVALIAIFGHRATLRVTSASYQQQAQPFLVADERHFVTRFHEDGPRGKQGTDDLRSASALLGQFETMWVSGGSTTTGVPLGI